MPASTAPCKLMSPAANRGHLTKLQQGWIGGGRVWPERGEGCSLDRSQYLIYAFKIFNCKFPPLVVPGGGGVGNRHLRNPKFSVAAHCVDVAKPPPKSAAPSIPVESGEHVQEFKVKWSKIKKILLPSAVHLAERLTVSQSVS